MEKVAYKAARVNGTLKFEANRATKAIEDDKTSFKPNISKF